MRKNTLFFIAVSAIILVFATRPIADPDFWWHLKTGEIIFQSHSIPKVDLFSFSVPGKEWITHEWLSELLIYSVFKLGGLATLIFLFATIVCATFSIVYLTALRRGADFYVSGLVVLAGAAATLPVWGVRPQIISMLLTAAFVAILFEYVRVRESRGLWPLPILILLWANLHASYALGVGLILLAAVAVAAESLWEGLRVREAIRSCLPLVLLFFAAIAISLINPSGYKLLTYPFETLASPMMQAHIEEWLSPDFHQGRFLALLVLIISSIVVLAVSPKRPRISDLVFLAAGMFAAMRSGRHAPLFALIAVPILAEHLSALVAARRSQPTELNHGVESRSALRVGFVVIALFIFAVHFRLVLREQPTTESTNYPLGAISFIKDDRSMDRVLNWYDWGGYMIWRLYPDRKVFIDGRADVYGDKLFEEYLNACNGQPGWEGTLKKFDINTVFIKPDSPLASLLRQSGSWRIAFEDKQAVIFANAIR